jgi:hypothetical protein
VLPMVNSTGDPANEYFSDGMSEEIISSLSRLHDLKVVGRTSSFQFKGKSDDSKTIGEKLGVHYLLEGSAHKSADRAELDAITSSPAMNYPADCQTPDSAENQDRRIFVGNDRIRQADEEAEQEPDKPTGPAW